MNTEWSTGYFIGIIGKTIEYVVATADGVFSCATIRRLPDDEAYDPERINIAKVTYRVSVLGGASSTPVGVRFGKTTSRTQKLTPPRPPWCPGEPGSNQKTFRNSATTWAVQGATNFRPEDQSGGAIMIFAATALRQSSAKLIMAKIALEEPKTDYMPNLPR